MIPVMIDSDGMEVWYGVTKRDLETLIRNGLPYVRVEGSKKRWFFTESVTEFFRIYQTAATRRGSKQERMDAFAREALGKVGVRI